MRKHLLALAMLFSCAAVPLSAAAEERKNVIVALRPPDEVAGVSGAALEARKDAIRELQQGVLDRVDPQGFELLSRWVTIPGFAARVTEAEWRRLETDPDVLRVDEDVPVELTLEQSVPLIGGDTVHADGFTGDGVTVAVVDSGVLRTHADLQGAVVAEACFCTNQNGTGCCPNGQTTQTGTGAAADNNGHGTHVAGIVAGRGLGVAPAASIVAVKVLDASNSFSNTQQVIDALDWIIDQRPDVDVVNMSLGTSTRFTGTCDSATSWTMDFATAINTLVSRGTVVTVSSGNEASATTMRAPACIQNALAVGATYDAALGSLPWQSCTDNTTAVDRIACFSNASSALDLLAPGSIINSLSHTGGRKQDSGTSMAAPHVAGAAAVLMDISSSLTPAQIENALESTGVPVHDSRNNTTYPRIDLEAAAASVSNSGSTTDVVTNGGFEEATATGNSAPGWTVVPAQGNTLIWRGSHPHSGSVYAYFGNSLDTFDYIKQNVTIPANATSAQLSFWVNVTSEETTTSVAFDTFDAWFATTGGSFVRTLAELSNLDKTRSNNIDGVYFKIGPIDVLAQKGQTLQLIFFAAMDESYYSEFRLDDVSLMVTTPPPDNPPSTSITNPANSSTVSGTVNVTATSSDDHGVASVGIYIDGVQKSSGSWYSWDTTQYPNGSHTIYSRATDTGGQTTTSSTVTVTVQNAIAPTVTLSATDSSAHENGPDNGTFTVARSGSTAQALTIHYSIGGTALNGTDYHSIPTSIVIPANASSQTTPIVPKSDALTEGTETVMLSLATSADYQIGSPSSGTVSIGDAPPPPPPDVDVPRDFNEDMLSDIFWRNASTTQSSVWLMNGTTYSGVLSTSVPAAWSPRAFGDFDEDGKADAFWHNASTGETSIWLMDGATPSTAVRSTTAPTAWVPMGGGDFNGDGMGDVLWRNASAGQSSIWLMFGTTYTGAVISTPVPAPWTPAVLGDFNANGMADVLWHDPSTGETSIWLMVSETVATAVRSTTVPTNWSPRGGGDFDGNGTQDVFWHNATTGETSVWLMNGTAVNAQRSTTVPMPWVPAAFGDFNGDGKGDVFWRNGSTGETSIWLMNGATPSTAVRSTTVPTSWVPVDAQ